MVSFSSQLSPALSGKSSECHDGVGVRVRLMTALTLTRPSALPLRFCVWDSCRIARSERRWISVPVTLPEQLPSETLVPPASALPEQPVMLPLRVTLYADWPPNVVWPVTEYVTFSFRVTLVPAPSL